MSEDLGPEHVERLARGLWWLPEAGDCEAVAAEMGIDPAAPVPPERHAEYSRRMDERIRQRYRERIDGESDELRARILRAYGLKPWDITASVRPP